MGYLHIENLYRNATVQLFRECYAMEKIHGCLRPDASVSMADGSKKKIKDVMVGDMVLGVVLDRLVPTKVVEIFDNGTTTEWTQVTVSRNKAGRGPATARIMCTGEHRFFNPTTKEYVQAKDLKPGDSSLIMRTSEIGQTILQEQVLLGKMLGDAHIYSSANIASINWSHREQDVEYLEWTCRAVGELDYGWRNKITSGYGSTMVRTRTVGTAWIKERFSSFIIDGKKTIPEWVANELTPIAIAFWYMDDGSLGHGEDGSEDKANFAVCGFTKEDCEILQKGLKRFNIGSVYYTSNNNKETQHSRLRLNADDAEKLFLLVAPYIPPCMQRKLPERYRGHLGWIPSVEQTYKPSLVEQTVLKIEKSQTASHKKIDIETESHNYIANGIVVHNSSAHVSWKGGQLTYFSGGEKYANFVALFNHDELVKKFQEHAALDDITVFGEAYGGKQQGQSWRYGKELKFCAFDVKIGDHWLDVPSAERFVLGLGFEFVFYKRVDTSIESLDTERDAPSEQAKRNGCGDDKPREGVVLRPIIEMRTSAEKRVIAKHKRAEEAETRKPSKPLSLEEQKLLDDSEAIASNWVTGCRLEHVLDKMKVDGEEVPFEKMGEITQNMVEDVTREGEGEIVVTKEVRKAIGNKTVMLFKKRCALTTQGRMDLWEGTISK